MKKLLLLLSVVLFSISCEKDGISEPDSRVVIDYKLSGTYETTPVVEVGHVYMVTHEGKVTTNQNTIKERIGEIQKIITRLHDSTQEGDCFYYNEFYFWFNSKNIHIEELLEKTDKPSDIKDFKIRFKNGKALFDKKHYFEHYDIIRDKDLLILSGTYPEENSLYHMKLPKNINDFYKDYTFAGDVFGKYPDKVELIIQGKGDTHYFRKNIPLVNENNTISIPAYKILYFSETKYADEWSASDFWVKTTYGNVHYWYPSVPKVKHIDDYNLETRETYIIQEYRHKLIKL